MLGTLLETYLFMYLLSFVLEKKEITDVSVEPAESRKYLYGFFFSQEIANNITRLHES